MNIENVFRSVFGNVYLFKCEIRPNTNPNGQ